ncbi:MAG: Clusterin-associated protein-1 [Rhodobacteraceae bacterium HLUCCA12]|nr:MAG: Clusterin-associated protein-1 [Rhodobacteraceae bacterium HLUCCA12]
MRNKLSDLNNHLFAQLERMAEDGMSQEKIEQEAKRAEAIVSVADQITRNADLQLKAAKLFAEHGQAVLPMLPQIGGPKE